LISNEIFFTIFYNKIPQDPILEPMADVAFLNILYLLDYIHEIIKRGLLHPGERLNMNHPLRDYSDQ